MKNDDVFVTNDLNKADLFNEYFVDQCTLNNENAVHPAVTYSLKSQLEHVAITEEQISECMLLINVSNESELTI